MAKASFVNEISRIELGRFLHEDEQGITFSLKVKPHATQERLFIGPEQTLTLSVRSVAADNAANERVFEILAELFAVPLRSVVLVSGHKSRIKRIRVKVGKNVS